MVNKVKEIVNRLDGYSDSGLAFAVTEVKMTDLPTFLQKHMSIVCENVPKKTKH